MESITYVECIAEWSKSPYAILINTYHEKAKKLDIAKTIKSPKNKLLETVELSSEVYDWAIIPELKLK